MARTSTKFKVTLEAEDAVTPAAKKAESSVSQFLKTSQEAAKEAGGLFGKLAATLGPVGTGLVGLGAAVVGLRSIADFGARSADAVEKLGAASKLSSETIREMRVAADGWNSANDELEGALGALASKVTDTFTPAIETLAAAFRSLGGNQRDASKEIKQTSDAVETDLDELVRRAKAAEDTRALLDDLRAGRNLTRGSTVDFGEGESTAIEGKTPTQKREEGRDRAASIRAFEDAMRAREGTAWGDIVARENEKNSAIASLQERWREARREWTARQDELDLQRNEDRFQKELEAYQRKESAFAAIGDGIGSALSSGIQVFLNDLATAKSSIGEATRDLFGGVISQVGGLLIQLGTAGLLMSALGSVIPALALVTGAGLGVTASLAAIAGGTAMVGIGGAISGIGAPSSASVGGSAPGGNANSTWGQPETSMPPVGRDLPPIHVHFHSVVSDSAELGRFTDDRLIPILQDRIRRRRFEW